MQIRFQEATLKNFKSHQDLSVNFGEVTEVTGDNAEGKSSILDALMWTVYGTDVLGRKLDPTPITYDAEETAVTLLLSIDDKQVKLGRSLKKGKASYHINDVPSKAGEFNDIVDSLGGKELFLSLFNPSYFFSLHWEKQRAMVLQFVTAPANKEVMKELPELQSEKLAALVKKHSLEDLQKIHKDQKAKLEKEHIAAQSRAQTLKEQLEQREAPSLTKEGFEDGIKAHAAQKKEVEKTMESAAKDNERVNTLKIQINRLLEERDRMKEKFQELKGEEIEETCRVCKQPLQDESLQAAEEEKQKRVDQFKSEYEQVVQKRKELEEELEQLEYVDINEQLEQVREYQAKIDTAQAQVDKIDEYNQLQEQVAEAAEKENETRDNLNESIFILDAVKAFYAAEADLQVQKVQDLFETLGVRLFEEQKNGDLKPTFEIELNEKPYRELSLSEKIRAGLELREVLSDQAEIVAPVFVDNAESISRFKEPNGQLVTSRVVTGEELEVTADE
ncbi:AAA family ATPase [Salibacterium lacus]|uniref:Nuclease SbcCD subunit C n=1 Tax=Salibacterium lacus TaxID=1898109 RepID=A0ABW5T0G9_9BACI